MSGNNLDFLGKAYNFAEIKHYATGKLYNGKRYIVHPAKVAEILGNFVFHDENLRAAGLLHDTLEDTNTTYEELVSEFNEDIANLVREVTKDENGDFPIKTERGLILKCADRLANIISLPAVKDDKRREKLFKKYSHCFIHEGHHKDL